MKGQRNKGRKGKKRTEGAESRVEFGGAKSVVCVRETSSRCLAAEGRSDVHLQFTPRRKSRLESGTVHLAKNHGGGTNTVKSRAKCPPKPYRPTLLDTVDASSHSLAPLKLPAKARG